jgi:hypothetical protein
MAAAPESFLRTRGIVASVTPVCLSLRVVEGRRYLVFVEMLQGQGDTRYLGWHTRGAIYVMAYHVVSLVRPSE